MQPTIYNPPQFIEELTFRVRPDMLETYIELDARLWVPALRSRKGFLGSEVWVGEPGSGEVTMLYFWERYEDFAGLDVAWLEELKQKTNDVMGDAIEFIGAMESARKWRVREYS
ncbi:MAG: TIGR03792 family protein [Christensenellaceae bacterium]|jgi:uncharacterized protein (TIGR03792 family)|nr:TIGR03792 family protein [Christensenellaceae bacterium]